MSPPLEPAVGSQDSGADVVDQVELVGPIDKIRGDAIRDCDAIPNDESTSFEMRVENCGHSEKRFSRATVPRLDAVLIDFRLYGLRQVSQRFLPAEVTRLERHDIRQAFQGCARPRDWGDYRGEARGLGRTQNQPFFFGSLRGAKHFQICRALRGEMTRFDGQDFLHGAGNIVSCATAQTHW
jgi:hypothetical protein